MKANNNDILQAIKDGFTATEVITCGCANKSPDLEFADIQKGHSR